MQALGGGGGSTCALGSYEYTATRFIYSKNGETVTHVTGESWCAQDNESCPDTTFPLFQTTFAKEFRYDGTRQRYLDRDLNTSTLQTKTIDLATWSDYDEVNNHGDYTVTSGVATNAASYQPGMGKVDSWVSSGSTSTKYYHSDALGTTRMMTDDSGAQVEDVVYTAFGERISGSSRRYGYVGSFGYQSHDEMQYQHVGARYYDPSSGRFLQRDPIGISGGPNVYAYVFNRPTMGVDPTGNSLWDWVASAGAAIGIGLIGVGTVKGSFVAVVVGVVIVAISAAILWRTQFINFWVLPNRAVKPFENYRDELDGQIHLTDEPSG